MKQKKNGCRPFILYPRQSIAGVRQCVRENFGSIKYELPFLNALCVEIPEEKVGAIRTNQRIAMMSEDIEVSKLPVRAASRQPAGRSSSSLLSRQPAPAPSGGEGVCLAVIDTGVAPHYDLIRPFNRILHFKDFVNGRKQPYDDDGHGTHVAGIAVRNGYASGGTYRGTAPGAALVSLKALDEDGNGNASDILAAMQWIYDNHQRYHIRVVNLSLGVEVSARNQIDPLAIGANALVCAGLCVVAAAGNSGPEKKSVTSPGVSPLVLTVGSCDRNGTIPRFSSRGPTPAGQVKPDVVAPGVDIVSLSAENPKSYLAQTGTSMSSPYVAGLALDYCARCPGAHPLEVKDALMNLAQPLEGADKNEQGCGALIAREVSSPAASTA